MTRDEAAEKVAKLMRLARDNANPHEASAARSQAKKIVDDLHLTLEELSSGKKARAFNDLVAAVRQILAAHPEMPAGLFGTSGIVSGILSKLEALSEESKSKRLDEAGKLIETASMFNSALSTIGFGSSIVPNIKKIFQETLAAHGLAQTH